MNVTETGQIMRILKAAYPRFYANVSADEQKEVMLLWLDMFKDDDVRLVGAAVKALIATDNKGFPPVIGQVKEKMHTLAHAQDGLNEVEAWSMVKKAIRNGYYGSVEEFGKLPAQCQKLVGSPNQLREWAMMPSEELDTVVASNFQRGFRTVQTRDKEYAMIPESVKAVVSKLGAGMAFGLLEGER